MMPLLTGVNLVWYLLRRLGLRPLFAQQPALEPEPEALSG